MELHGEAGDDLLIGGLAAYVLMGGSGADVLRGAEGDDVLHGGGGADSLRGGLGNDVMVGGTGNDSIDDGSGANVLIGGDGFDILSGGDDGSLLVGGSTVHDDDEEALLAILAEWSSERSLEERVANLTDGSGTVVRANEDYFLRLGLDVLDDYDYDVLYGGSGSDWYFRFSRDYALWPLGDDRVN